jgi:hypothetical protein
MIRGKGGEEERREEKRREVRRVTGQSKPESLQDESHS